MTVLEVGFVVVGMTLIIAMTMVRIAYYGSENRLDFEEAEYLIQTGRLPETAYYPPGVTLIGALTLLIADDPFVGAISVKLLAIFAASYLFLQITKGITNRGFLVTSSLVLLVGNPYFFWTALNARDFSFQFLFFVMMIFAALRYTETSRCVAGFWLTLSLFCAFSGPFIRVTTVFSYLGFIGSMWIRAPRKRLGIISLAVAVFGSSSLLVAYNYIQVGLPVLSTSAGLNLYFGNHRDYFLCHPTFDIDVCLADEVRAEIEKAALDPGSATFERESYKLLINSSFEFIKTDLASLTERVILKLDWIFVSLHKVPLSRADELTLNTKDDRSLLRVSQISGHLESVTYSLYRLVWVPLFWLTVLFVILHRSKAYPFVMPLFAIAPILALTFPDTRFHLAESSIAILGMIAVAEEQLKPNVGFRDDDLRRSESM